MYLLEILTSRLQWGYMLDDQDKEWISDRLRESETRLLTEIHKSEERLTAAFRNKWAAPFEARNRSNQERLTALEIDMQSVKEDLDKLRGTNGPTA